MPLEGSQRNQSDVDLRQNSREQYILVNKTWLIEKFDLQKELTNV